MSFRPCSMAPAVAAVVMILLVFPASARAAQGGLDDWRVLHKFERHALDDYIRHKSTSDVAQRGQLLMTMARSPAFSALGANCRRAAETLSYMVSGYYWSAQRLEVALRKAPGTTTRSPTSSSGRRASRTSASTNGRSRCLILVHAPLIRVGIAGSCVPTASRRRY
jgi:hypothetical protein